MKTYTITGKGKLPHEVILSKPELAVRLVEVLTKSDRPEGLSATQLLLDLEARAPDVAGTAMALADAASDYFLECFGLEPTEQ